MTKERTSSAKPNDWDANSSYMSVDVAEDYDRSRFSSIPGQVFNNWERARIRSAFKDIPAGSQIVDVPCGTGRLAEPLLEAGYRVHGMDISAEMLAQAEKRLARFGDSFSTEVVDAKDLDRKHEQYDAALCARVLMHFELDEQVEFLKGVVQSTSGLVVINHSLSSPYQRLRRGLKRLLGHQLPARYPITMKEIKYLLAQSGLRKIGHLRLNPIISEAIYIIAEPIPD
jgi:2-polyprenyl-3-methyl-5-hydroxy-6-metoxy-1,4-benzoquinol methylase